MKHYLKGLILRFVIVIIPGCLFGQGESRLVEGYKVGVYKDEVGSFKGLTTFVMDSSESWNAEGLTITVEGDQYSYGNISVFTIPEKDRITPFLERNPEIGVKKGKWVYFQPDGKVDSVIIYNAYKGYPLTIKEGEIGGRLYVDSIFRVSYDKVRLF